MFVWMLLVSGRGMTVSQFLLREEASVLVYTGIPTFNRILEYSSTSVEESSFQKR